MHNPRIRLVIAFVLLGLMATLSANTLYQAHSESGISLAEQLPLELDGWTGRIMPVDAYIKAILETDDIIQRNYVSPRYPDRYVQLAVVFSPENRRVAHPPEVCYTGAGWEMQDKRIIEPKGTVPLVRLILNKGPARDVVLYCYMSGKDITASYYRQQINIIRNQFLNDSTSSAMIRFSSPVVNSEEETEAMVLDFIRKMMPRIQATLAK